MDCNNTKKLIQEYLDGDAEFSDFSAHLDSCAQCRRYYESMLRQRELVRSLSPENPPVFSLAAAKRRKKAMRSRTVGWVSAAAAVFVVVLITGSMGLFSGASSGESMMQIDGNAKAAVFTEKSTDEEFDTMILEEAVADEAPAEPAAPAPAEIAGEIPQVMEEPAEDLAAEHNGAVCHALSSEEFDALRAALDRNFIAYDGENGVLRLTVTEDVLELVLRYCPAAEAGSINEFFIEP